MKFLVISICFLLLSGWSLSCIPLHTSTFSYVHTPHPREEIAHKVIHIWIDKNFGNADLVSIQYALDQWQFALNGYIVFQVDETPFDMEMDVLKRVSAGDGWIFMKIDRYSRLFQDKPGTEALAFADQVGGHYLYLIRDRIPNEWVAGVVMHEMGHLLGAAHCDGSLMEPQFHAWNSGCVDLATLKLVAAYQHLPLDNLNYCQYGQGSSALQEVKRK
jgi:hypothetical protein